MAQPQQDNQGRHPLIGAELIESITRDFASAGFMVERLFVRRFVASLLTKRFVILTGMSGSGKTRLAQAFAAWLSSESAGRPELGSSTTPELSTTDRWLPVGAELPSGRVHYRVDAIDSLAVEFSNERGDGQRIRVTLPKGVIEEWVAAINRNGFTRETTARTIREEVALTTKYSTQLNSFETHLKAAAFAMIEQSDQYWTQATRRPTQDGENELSASEKQGSNSTARAANQPYTVVAVGADWSTNESVLGYPDALHPGRFVRTPVLDLILAASSQPHIPHFLILDEMNLSHVERYFSDVLSAIESGEPIHLYADPNQMDEGLRDGVPSSIHLPDNLFIIGTVNIDETTYMFSPKVLDRANTIEFRVDVAALESFLNNPNRLQINSLRSKGNLYATAFLTASRDSSAKSRSQVQSKLNSELTLFFHTMAEHGYEFGFRTALEISRFTRKFLDLGDDGKDVDLAIDAQIYQKILPRLNGSRARLEPVLRSLVTLCSIERDWDMAADGTSVLRNRDAIVAAATSSGMSPQFETTSTSLDSESGVSSIYPLSHSKLQRMTRLLRQNGFVSFAEA